MHHGLDHVEPGTGGIRRRVAGRGFSYHSANGRHIRSPWLLERIRELAIPPAWTDVWISSAPEAHILATGVDAAGRTQYIYHPRWREERENEKYLRSQAFAQRLPAIRRRVTRDLRQTLDPRRRALAAAVRLMDRAALRVGGAAYARENGSFGATTLLKRHVECSRASVHLKFAGKSDGTWHVSVDDALLAGYFASLPRTPRSGPAICHPVPDGRRKRWTGVNDTEVNEYLGEIAGQGFTAKDFRTWQGTAVAALSLSRSLRAGVTSPEAVTMAVHEAADWLHNTPEIARDSYVDPRVIDLFEQGKVADLRRQPDRAVLALLLPPGAKQGR
ncbi:DNA topoisomerase IB [Paeniglutamicibacter sp. ABSL32-1]|uniref:DNA topoisomerase IB n=1 Tax=Paeniglutamicibacter quisquiliarum TaxID=2849498 RepID=UPI001C2D84D0|nr:DNA topoisomerase IB [Paeniglutamicibacter quisquiliarum]MBV1780817.1 DNA topoisomerase IB [Paeniglutamicibacter quisquiliarum]